MTTLESLDSLNKTYEAMKARQLSLNLTRGQPATSNYDLSNPMLTIVGPEDCFMADGRDLRNYPGGIQGLPEARALFAPVLQVAPEEMIVWNNSSLELMGTVLTWAMLKGVPGSEKPWGAQQTKFIVLVPGYDRHFKMLDTLGIELISVRIGPEGPDLDQIEALVAEDASIKGLFAVPLYSNPTGHNFNETILTRLASMPTAAPDFRLFLDNAYVVHHLYQAQTLPNTLELCRQAGHPNRVYLFGSTSKITFAGAGLGFMGSSRENMAHLSKLMGTQSIGPNKIEQWRHVRFFESIPGGILAHMARHAEIIRPKFEAVLNILEAELGGTGLASWSNPSGGYFISLDTQPGQAQSVVEMAASLGVKLTPAGATFPYGDPEDRNIRLSPTRPPLDEVIQATEVIALCVKRAAALQN